MAACSAMSGCNLMDQFTRGIVGFGVQGGIVDGVGPCRMFNRAIRNQGLPINLSSDHDPLYRVQQWQANLCVPGEFKEGFCRCERMPHRFTVAFHRIRPKAGRQDRCTSFLREVLTIRRRCREVKNGGTPGMCRHPIEQSTPDS
jgi:hypothetical protein